MGVLTRVGMWWTSHLGTRWDLMAGTEGAVLPEGLKSVFLPKFTPRTHTSARVPGVRFDGIDWDAGELGLTVTVGDTWVSRPDGRFRRGDEWLLLDRAFRDSFSPLYPGTLEVQALSETRRFVGRLVELDLADTAAAMPDIAGHATYSITVASESPFYLGKPQVYDFGFVGAAAPENYYGPANAGPDFYITGGNALGNVVLTNPGQVEEWPTWTVDGPGQAVLGIGDHITYTHGLAAGERLVIVTDPNGTTVEDGAGNRAWDRIAGLYDFAPVEPGDNVLATAQIVGGGPGANIRLELATHFLSAY